MVLADIPYDTFQLIEQVQQIVVKKECNASLFSGSGGELANFFSTNFSGETQVTLQIEKPSISLPYIMEYIISSFGLTMEDMKTVCGIQSRKTLYNWLEGASLPRDSSMIRMFNLFTLAKDWKNAGLPNKRQLLLRPILNNQSIFDLLQEHTINKEKIMFAGSRLALGNMQDLPQIKEPFPR